MKNLIRLSDYSADEIKEIFIVAEEKEYICWAGKRFCFQRKH